MKYSALKTIKLAIMYSILGLILQVFIVSLVFAISPNNAQSLDEVTVNINVVNKSLGRVFSKIEEQTDYRFSYIKDEIPIQHSTTLKAINSSLKTVLNQLASAHDIEFTKIDMQIVVKNKHILFVEKEEENGKIKGIIIDANSNDPLIGANVMIVGTSIGAAANIDGQFILTSVKPGSYKLKITYVGYKEKIEEVTVVSNRATEITVKLDWVAVEGEVVLVTAQAKGQLAAINEQLSADEIKNVVSRDRIRELPDANAAESVGRLPGVSIMRSGGEGDKVVIRGLSPKYSKIMVDGVALVATGNGDRSVSMSSISSYSLEGIEVIKAPTASMDGDQVGGSVNFKMKTAESGFNSGVVIEGSYNNLKNTYSNFMFVGDISNRFFEDKFGLFAQISVDRKNLSSNQMHAEFYFDKDKGRSLRTEQLNLNDVIRDRKRIGGTFTLDYLLPDGKIYFENFFSSGDNDQQSFEEGYSRARRHWYNTSDNSNSQLIYSNVLNYEQYISTFKVSAKLSHSYSETEALNNIEFSFFKSGDVNQFPDDIDPKDIPDYSKNEIAATNWSNIRVGDKITKGRQVALSLNFETDFTLSKQINGKIKFGGKGLYADHSYDYKNGYSGSMASLGGNAYKIPIVEAFPWMQDIVSIESLETDFAMPYTLFIDNDYKHSEFIKGRYTLGPVADIDLMRDIVDVLKTTRLKLIELGQHDPGYFGQAHKTSVTNDYFGTEHLFASYIMANINITNKIKFIPGVRYEVQRTKYTGVRGKTQHYVEESYPHYDTTTVRNNYFFLPRVHLRYEPFNWLQVRLAYTQSVARPSYSSLIPRVDITPNSIFVNNYNLRPERAESYDISFAFNENHLGLFTIGGFYKVIEDKIFIRRDRVLHNPEDYNLSSIYKDSRFDADENNESLSYVKGIELDWQTNFWYLPSFLKGIVLNINYTKIFSKTKYPLTKYVNEVISNPPYIIKNEVDISYWARMQQQPDDILNISLGYDYKGFSCRVSMFYQGDNFITSKFNEEEHILTDSFSRWDLSVKQRLPWQNIQLYFNFVNINEGLDRDFIRGNGKTSRLEYYGSTLQLGLRWNY